MPYDTDIECGEELEKDILDGTLTEADLTESGKRKLALYRALPASVDFTPRGTDEDIAFLFPVDKPENS